MALGYFTRVPSLRLGGMETNTAVVGLWEDGSSLPFDGTIGSGILDRTVLTVDYARARLILEAVTGETSVRPFFDASGLLLVRGQRASAISMSAERAADEQGALTTVAYVVDDSPASAAGIAVGDELVRIDGSSVRDQTLAELRRLLAVPGETRRVTLRRAGQLLTTGVALRELV